MKQPTRNDVAYFARVSGATVSRVLSGRKDLSINEETRARVLEAASQLGYRPNQAARSLVTGRTNTIGLLTMDSFTPYSASIARHVTEQAERSGFRVAVQHYYTYRSVSQKVAFSPHWQVDGLIVFDLPRELQHEMEAWSRLALPLVAMGAYYPEQGDYVGVDLLGGAQQALNHLIAQGYRRLAFMMAVGTYHPTEPRCQAYDTLMQAAGLSAEFIYIPETTRAAARQGIAAYIGDHGCPEAIFCRNDDLAIGCYRGLCDMKLRVPEDIALVGCDGIEDTEYLECPITTIVQPVALMCAQAWDYLQRRMTEPTTSAQQKVLPTHLALRPSSQRKRSRP